MLLEDEGLPAPRAAEGIATSPMAFAKTKVEKELGLAYGSHHSETATPSSGSPTRPPHSSRSGPTSLAIATALMVSPPATAIALFALGIVKARAAKTSRLCSGPEVLLIGGASAAVGYAIGWLGHVLAG
jgi:hypothetical protein